MSRPFKMKGSAFYGKSNQSPLPLQEVLIDGESIGTGSKAREDAKKIAMENKRLIKEQDDAGVDPENQSQGREITFTDEDEKINEQAKTDLDTIELGKNLRGENLQSSEAERRNATGKYTPWESDAMRDKRIREAKANSNI